mgnify:CR=1 FL=1
MASTIQVRVDDDLEIKSDQLFKDLGTDTTTANPYGALSENEILKKLEKAREHAEQGMYKDACDVSRDMRAKYGI